MKETDLELYEVVGKMFREIRENRNYSLEYVAEYLGITPKTLQRYEVGERNIKIKAIKSLCKFYNLDCSEFMKNAKLRFVSDIRITEKVKSDYTKSNFHLSEAEKQIIISYRKADEIRKASVLMILGLEEKGEAHTG